MCEFYGIYSISEIEITLETPIMLLFLSVLTYHTQDDFFVYPDLLYRKAHRLKDLSTNRSNKDGRPHKDRKNHTSS